MNRLLGVSEHLRWLLDQRWSFNFTLNARVRGAITVQQLTDALTWVQRRHPLLAVRIATEDGQPPRFVSEGVANIPLRVVKRQGDEHWCQEAEAELSLPFSWNSGPLLRVVFLQGAVVSELIITCHHSIGDGLSALYLLRDILLEISTPGTTREILPELPSWEELIFLSQGNISHNAIAAVAPTQQKIGVSDADIVLNRVSDQEAISGNKRSSILHWCLSPEETAMLVSRCSEKQSSVQGAICAAFLLSMAEEMNSSEDAIHKCVSPCNVRNYLVPAIGEDFGLYISGLFTSHTLKPETSFWGLAQEVKHQINDLIVPEKIFQYIRPTKAFLSTQPDPQMVYQQMAQKGDLCVTNLGRLNIPQQFGSLSLEAIYGPIVQSSENIKIVSVATLGGKIFFTFTFSESVLSRSLAEKIKAGAMQRIAVG
ncbi:putative polyketide synthase component [Cylindrospermum stagnale PCC 7417]|uniref:Phthiocerol/phthiodiolone dimycocerosyl transferase n=1 Tax=Cylindrospermum stagnale PCC 7417 TaxID=56107 RepID=K9WS64_9NOST|nr:condensation domain-containing protein [Cylindrospermum stagnale]AFZ22397.1 putative polyketide synthase component [Cylindrospermum stagnale PCC 7417]